MIETVKILREELQSVKTDNERILKAQEELNDVLLNKILSQEADKNKKQITDTVGTATYKRKARKLNFSDTDTNSTNDQTESNEHKIEYSSETSHSDHQKNKMK